MFPECEGTQKQNNEGSTPDFTDKLIAGPRVISTWARFQGYQSQHVTIHTPSKYEPAGAYCPQGHNDTHGPGLAPGPPLKSREKKSK